MVQSLEVDRFKKYWSLAIGDAERLQDLINETDICMHYSIAPGLATVPRLSLILGALYVFAFKQEWGIDTGCKLQLAFISYLTSILPEGRLKNNKNDLFVYFMKIARLVEAELHKGDNAGEPPLYRAPYIILYLIFGINTEEAVTPYLGLLAKLHKELQYSIPTICIRMNDSYQN